MSDLDNDSIRLLRELENGELTAPELANRTNLSRGQVHYRLKNKLSDRVTQTDTRANPGSAAPTTVWSLSADGQDLLDDLSETPETFEEIAEIAEEAASDAESAKESVRKYRKKVNRLKDRQDAIKEALPAESWETMGTTPAMGPDQYEQLDRRIDGVRDDLQDDLDELQANVAQDINQLSTKVGEQGLTLQQLQERHSDTEYARQKELERAEMRIQRLEQRLNELESRTLLDHLLDHLPF